MKPLVFDLFCGLFGWGESFAQVGFRVVGFDIEDQFKNFGKTMPENCELFLRDVKSIKGEDLVREFGIPVVIVASSPCQSYSYMAMPWSKAKAMRQKILDDETGKMRAELNELFEQPARIQREIFEATGKYVPMIQENVRGAQEWVGKAQYHFGSFYLWGDIPALMPQPQKLKLKTTGPTTEHQAKNHNCHINEMRDALKGEGNKTAGMNWSDQSKRGQDFTRITGQQAEGGKSFNIAITYRELKEKMGTKGYASRLGDSQVSRMYSSKSKARKEASALIAKIPPTLASWIAWTFKPK